MDTKYVNVDEKCMGEIIAEDLYDAAGTLIISRNAVINEYVIDKLFHFGITSIAVFNSPLDIKEETKKQSYVEFKISYQENVDSVKEVLADLASGKELNFEKVDNLSNSLFSKVSKNYYVVDCLNEMRTMDEYTYYHGINVSIYAMLLAKWLNLSERQVKDVTLAGILHDLGKARIPEAILNKKGALLPEEYEKVKEHSVLGYNIVKSNPQLSKAIIKVVLMHHEREDGSGYPLGVTGDKLNLYTKIIAVADVYDAMTSERAYRQRFTPFETFREFENTGYGKFDTRIMLTFLANIANFYSGAKVRMNTGEAGEIVYVPPHDISHPVVKINNKYIDTAKYKEFTIAQMI